MGQCYRIVNIDKKEYLNPYVFGDGAKLLEFGSSGSGTMCALACLLANSNNRGGGDLRSENPLIGSWAGDRIVIAGDYAIKGDPAETADTTLYDQCRESFKDISRVARDMICEDSYIAESIGIGWTQET